MNSSFDGRNRFFKMKVYHALGVFVSWLAWITSAIGNSNQPSELNVVNRLYTHIYL
jgi:hypothetical protein